MRILSNINALLYAAILIAGLLTGCGSNSKKDGILILKSSPFPEIQGRNDIAAELNIGGKTCSLTVDPDTTLLSGQCPDLSLGALSYTLDYRHTPSGAVVARADGTITIAAGGNSVIDIPTLDKKLDDDEDGFTNLEEVLAGTDPENPDPGVSLVKLVVTLSGVGTGSVLYDPPGIDSAAYGAKLYPRDTSTAPSVVTLTAVPDTGYAFAGWGGDCTGTASSIMVTLDADKACSATFNVPWTISTLDSAGTVGQYSSIALDSANNVHIAYYDATDAYLKYISHAAGSWGPPELVDPSGILGSNTSIAVDSADQVHIAYYNGDLKYATNISGSWVPTAVDISGDVGQYTSIALDATNKVHIGYYDVSNTALKYAACSTSCTVTSNWAALMVDNSGDVGQFASLAVDATGARHIGYYDATNSDLKYAESIPPVNLFSDDFESGLGQWAADPPWDLTASSFHSGSNSATDSPAGNYGRGIHISLTMTVPITINGAAELSFWHRYAIENSANCDADCARVEVSTDGGATWTQLDRYWGSPLSLTPWTSVSIDLSRYINPSVKIRFLLSTDSISQEYDGWYIDDVAVTQNYSVSTVDTAGDAGQYASIALDSMNKAHMSYYDATNRDLKYATNATGSWTTTTIDSGGDVGMDSSVAVDSNGKAHIAYYDATNGNLKYATNATGSWIAYTIDSAGDVGRYASIAVDSNGKVHIAYYDAANKDLKYAASP